MSETIINPGAHVRHRIDVIAPTAWIHPQYATRCMEFVFPDGTTAICPLLGRPARGFRWRLSKDLYLIPESVEVF